MEAKAIGKFIRVSTRKARIPAEVIKGMGVVEAVAVLKYMEKGSAHPVKKVLESAISNAVHNYGMKESDLIVSEVMIDRGPSLRRVEYKAKGSVAFYNRPMSHITVIVRDQAVGEKSKKSTKVKETKSTETKAVKKTSTKVKKQKEEEVEVESKE